MLTASQQVAFLRRMGWPADSIEPDSVSYVSDVRSLIVNFSDEVVKQIQEWLVILDDIDNRLRGTDGLDRTQATTLDNLQLNPEERMQLRKEKNSIIFEMRTLTRLGHPSSYGIRYF